MKSIPNLRLVRIARFCYKNQHGDVRIEKPKGFTRLNALVPTDEKLFGSGKLLIEVLKERNALDIWTPELILEFSKEHTMFFTGEEAEKLWSSYKAVIYRKGK